MRFSALPFPQYRIPIQRLKEEWAFRLRMERLRRKRRSPPPSKLTDNREPWIKNPSSVAEFREIACHVNETVAQWAPQFAGPRARMPARIGRDGDPFSQALLEDRGIPCSSP